MTRVDEMEAEQRRVAGDLRALVAWLDYEATANPEPDEQLQRFAAAVRFAIVRVEPVAVACHATASGSQTTQRPKLDRTTPELRV